MRERIKDKGRLEHILKAIDVLLSNKDRYTFDEMVNDPIIFFGFVKHVEIIGEAVYMLTKEFREQHPGVDWEVIEGMRHVLVHGYYKIKPKQLWNTIEVDIPTLRPIIEKYWLLEQESE
ncbi:MAG: DUF86 domain-containing protein [Bacteroides sp.]|nr:DUF86 domain-containing protein [Bacteroides sp.]